MTVTRKTIGFDRKIQLDWLDATAGWAGQGLSVPEIRARLDRLLEGKVAGSGPRSARAKTMTVLLHIWVLVPDALVPLRDEGLALLRDRTGRDRLPLHWGMCTATYPFFSDVATTTGRLLALQGNVALSQIVRRMSETWGERSTLIRAVQRIVRSFVAWDVLVESGERGVFSGAPRLKLGDANGAASWLIEAEITNSERRVHSFRGLVSAAAHFPFELHVSAGDIHRNPRLELHRQGGDQDVVVLRQGRVTG